MSNYQQDYESENVLDKTFEQLATSSMGVRALINQAKIKAILKSYKLIKSTFGFEASIERTAQFIEICEYFKKICGVNIIKENKQKDVPLTQITKVFKITKGTFCLMSWDNTVDRYPGYMYVFGKKSFRYFNYIKNNI